jgi:hypothetical protein
LSRSPWRWRTSFWAGWFVHHHPVSSLAHVSSSYAGYLSSGRIASGVIVAFLLCLRAGLQSGRVAQAAWLPIALWLLTWYTVLPEAVRR